MIEAVGIEDHPEEACGFIVRERGGKLATLVHTSENRASNPREFFRIEDFAEVDSNREVLAIWHTHPNRPPTPSEADKTLAESCGLPLFIVGIPTREWGCYFPNGWRAPLLNREFAHGIQDCWSVIRDCLRWPDMRTWAGADRETKIELPDFDRPDDWWLNGGNLYLDNAKRAGFVRVPGVQTWDVILIQMRSPVPNHAALYVGDGLMLHHLEGRRSALVPYLVDRGAYARHTYGVYRHESLC